MNLTGVRDPLSINSYPHRKAATYRALSKNMLSFDLEQNHQKNISLSHCGANLTIVRKAIRSSSSRVFNKYRA